MVHSPNGLVIGGLTLILQDFGGLDCRRKIFALGVGRVEFKAAAPFVASP
jgi:hypothetical protein